MEWGDMGGGEEHCGSIEWVGEEKRRRALKVI